MTRFRVDLAKMQSTIIDGAVYYKFMPISKYADLVINEKGETFTHYHFNGVTVEQFGSHKLGGLVCQPLCGHRLDRFHASCLTCGYRKSWYGKMPRLLPIKMMYQVFIPRNVPLQKLKDVIRKKLLTLVEMTCT